MTEFMAQDFGQPLATVYAALGDFENAFIQLEKAYATKDNRMNTLKISAFWDPIRSDPPFSGLS